MSPPKLHKQLPIPSPMISPGNRREWCWQTGQRCLRPNPLETLCNRWLRKTIKIFLMKIAYLIGTTQVLSSRSFNIRNYFEVCQYLPFPPLVSLSKSNGLVCSSPKSRTTISWLNRICASTSSPVSMTLAGSVTSRFLRFPHDSNVSLPKLHDV